jgi:hypothetical protein
MLKCISYKKSKKIWHNLCEEISKMYTFLLFKFFFFWPFGVKGGERGGEIWEPFYSWQMGKGEKIPQVWQGEYQQKGDLTDSAPEHVSKLHGRWNHSEWPVLSVIQHPESTCL